MKYMCCRASNTVLGPDITLFREGASVKSWLKESHAFRVLHTSDKIVCRPHSQETLVPRSRVQTLQEMISDAEPPVRAAVAATLAKLLPYLPDLDKYNLVRNPRA